MEVVIRPYRVETDFFCSYCLFQRIHWAVLLKGCKITDFCLHFTGLLAIGKATNP